MNNMKRFMETKAKSIRILSDEKMNEKLEEAMKVNSNINKQSFLGGDLADEIVKEMVDGLSCSMVYLKSKDRETRTGLIEVVYVYHPFDMDRNSDPQCIDGFSFEVDLPFSGEGGIANFI